MEIKEFYHGRKLETILGLQELLGVKLSTPMDYPALRPPSQYPKDLSILTSFDLLRRHFALDIEDKDEAELLLLMELVRHYHRKIKDMYNYITVKDEDTLAQWQRIPNNDPRKTEYLSGDAESDEDPVSSSEDDDNEDQSIQDSDDSATSSMEEAQEGSEDESMGESSEEPKEGFDHETEVQSIQPTDRGESSNIAAAKYEDDT
ncbi:MAG: hypothetical protein Q9222_006766 [Ikaeria aurantiellina]